MTGNAKEWRFTYSRNGKHLSGFFSFAKPQRDEQRQCWFIQFKQDWDDSEGKIYGETPEQAHALAVEFFEKLYKDLDLKNTDGSPFDWHKVRQAADPPDLKGNP